MCYICLLVNPIVFQVLPPVTYVGNALVHNATMRAAATAIMELTGDDESVNADAQFNLSDEKVADHYILHCHGVSQMDCFQWLAVVLNSAVILPLAGTASGIWCLFCSFVSFALQVSLVSCSTQRKVFFVAAASVCEAIMAYVGCCCHYS